MLADRGIDIPIVFITGYGDIPMTVRAMKAGAVDFLAKPFRDQDLLDAVNAALELARERRSSSDDMRSVRQLYGTLTDREREVMQRVVKGLLNKEIAGELAIAEITVKAHRASLMRKMGVRRVPDLVRFAEMLARDDRD
jgi:FixJ family two-component response regulator